MAMTVAHDTDASTSTSTGTKVIIPLNCHLNKRNAIVSLMTASASCDKKHVIAMYMPKLICPSNVTYKSHVSISSCKHKTTMLVYIPHMNQMQSTELPQRYAEFHIICICP